VRGTRRRSSNTIFARRLGLPLVEADLADRAALERAMAGRDVVFFVAGHIPRFSVDTAAQVELAVSNLRRALEAAEETGVQRFVYTSSVATVGPPAGDRLATEDDLRTRVPDDSTYFAVKLALEREAMSRADTLDVVVVCPTGCLGPLDHKVGTGFFVLGVATGTLDVWVDGEVNMVDARDVARATVSAARVGERGARYILGGHNLSARTLLHHIAETVGGVFPARELSPAEAYALAREEERRARETGRGRPLLSVEMVDVTVHGQHVDCSRARDELALAPRPLHETLRDAHHWYADNGYLSRARRRHARSSQRKETRT